MKSIGGNMTKESRQKADASLRVDEQGGILVGLRLDPALSARRAELTDPAHLSETQDRLHDFAARLDQIEALGDLFSDDIDTVLRKPAPDVATLAKARPEPALVEQEAARVADTVTSAPQKADAELPEGDGFETGDASESGSNDVAETMGQTGSSFDIPSLRPPGASDFDDLYATEDETTSEPEMDVSEPEAAVTPDPVVLPAPHEAEDPFAAANFTRIDDNLAEQNARISEEVIEIGEIDDLPEDSVEDFAWTGFDPTARTDWEAVDDQRDFDNLSDPDFPDDEEDGESYGVLDEFLSRSDLSAVDAPADPHVAPLRFEDRLKGDPVDFSDEDEGSLDDFRRQPEDSLEDVLRDDIWLDDIMPDETAPAANHNNDDADVWENPMTRTDTETSQDLARDIPAIRGEDADPLAYLDDDAGPVAEKDANPVARPAVPEASQEAGQQNGILGLLGMVPEKEAAAPEALLEADGVEEPAVETAASVPAKGSRMPMIAASAVLAVALGFGLVNMGVIPLGSGANDLTASVAPDAYTPVTAEDASAPPALPTPPGGLGETEAQDPLSQELADLRDTAAPQEPPADPSSSEAADQLDRVAKGLEAAAEGDLNDLFLPENATAVPAAAAGPVVTQEILDGLATDADLAETRAAIERMFSDMQAMQAKATEREAAIGTLQARLAEIETLARRAETLALAQNEVIVDVVRLQEQMLTAEELIVDLSRRVAAIEAADPADRVSVDRSLEDLDRRISGLSRDVGLVARMSLNGSAAPLSLPTSANPKTSEPAAPGAGAIYQDSNTQITPSGANASQVPSGVKVGDFVDRYGYVLDVVPTSDGARLVVMENGSVIVP